MLSALSLSLLLAAATPASADDMVISFDVREAAIHDIVRVLAEVGDFQVVMEPGISCQLTLKLHQVPWPTVLEMALKSCHLGKVEELGVIRIASVAHLTEEATAEKRLQEERELTRPRTTTRLRLSYARAEELAPIIRKMLSARGEVIVDKRTNTLIITD
jgi:type IV pilus assembly protein PilQ